MKKNRNELNIANEELQSHASNKLKVWFVNILKFRTPDSITKIKELGDLPRKEQLRSEQLIFY